MKTRVISGAVFVAIVASFFVLRQFVDYRLFQILLWFFTAVSTFEVARALKPFTGKGIMPLAIVYGILFTPFYCIIKYLVFPERSYLFAIDLSLVFMIIALILNLACEKDFSVRKSLSSLVPFVYPAMFMLTANMMNDLPENSFVGMLLLFVISPFSDTFAYLVGMSFNKIKKGTAKKMCPELSPKKTWAGAIGGVVGGIIGALCCYFIFKPEVNFFSPALFFIVTGFIVSVLTELGDLFESFIKRRAGIKDMGKIMPGHGGITDRIDGMMFASAFLFLIFLIF